MKSYWSILSSALFVGSVALASPPEYDEQQEISYLQDIELKFERHVSGHEDEKKYTLMDINRTLMNIQQHRREYESPAKRQNGEDQAEVTDIYLETVLVPTLITELPDFEPEALNNALVLMSNAVRYFDREDNRLLLSSYHEMLENAGRDGVHPQSRSSIYELMHRLPRLEDTSIHKLHELVETEPLPMAARTAIGLIARQYHNSQSAKSVLPSILRSSSPEVRAAAAMSLAYFDQIPDDILSVLMELLEDHEERVRFHALRITTSTATREGNRFKPLVIQLEARLFSSTESLRNRTMAANALYLIAHGARTEELTSLLIRLAEDASLPTEIRAEIIKGIPFGSHYDETKRAFLETFLDSEDPSIRAAGERALLVLDRRR